MPRNNARATRSVPATTTSARLDVQSNAPIATTPTISRSSEESPSTPSSKELSTSSTWRSRLGSARAKHSPKSTPHKPDGSAKTGLIEFWADVWASGGDEDMLPPLPEHKPTETLTVGLELDGGAAAPRCEVSLADLIKPARSQRKPGKSSDFEIVPRVREVIALDDRNDGPEPDEAWEVVSSDGEDDGRAVMSYADIVANKTAA
ncbi:unnamed protein product [Peniophora sp. CBMAI 1063]|nr:unnamed protein product [Peniophora sp. CBMAI 1063]